MRCGRSSLGPSKSPLSTFCSRHRNTRMSPGRPCNLTGTTSSGSFSSRSQSPKRTGSSTRRSTSSSPTTCCSRSARHRRASSRSIREACRPDDNGGMMLYRLVNDIAERYLDLVDDLDGEIAQLEDSVETAPAEQVRSRLSELRHDLLHIRRTLAPTRDAVRRVVDNVVEVSSGVEVFPHDVEVAFNTVYDTLLRAFDGLELSRDLIASVRDYLQTKIANDQNEVVKKLTVIASVLLLPTFIVGLYGQNFRHHFPELGWQWGYAWSWGLIVSTTLLQLWFFRRKKWI